MTINRNMFVSLRTKKFLGEVEADELIPPPKFKEKKTSTVGKSLRKHKSRAPETAQSPILSTSICYANKLIKATNNLTRPIPRDAKNIPEGPALCAQIFAAKAPSSDLTVYMGFLMRVYVLPVGAKRSSG